VDSHLAALLRQTVTHRPFVSRDRYNKATYGAATPLAARITRRPKLIRAADGQEKMSSAEVWLDVWPTMGQEDQLTLDDGTAPPILRVDRLAGPDGSAHHTKVFLG
jgi:hypothetical protein